ncbi:MAG: PAS domain-containing protein [Phycisphaerales bacterium]|nr:MAG: PAS domain-containing protein [Phycisphaerales bacterium]
MGQTWTRFKKFWMAEEVPRWFGFSIVLVYLIGLGAVGYYGTAQVRKDGSTVVQLSSRYAVKRLADWLETAISDDPTDPVALRACELELRDFAQHVPTKTLRIVDGRRNVIASINATEVGRVAADEVFGALYPKALTVTPVPVEGRDAPDQFIRAPLAVNASDAPAELAPRPDGDAGAETAPFNVAVANDSTLYLEARLPPEIQGSSVFVHYSGTLTIALVAMGVLFGLYRCLRAQLRSASRIADLLNDYKDQIEHDLGSLRLADTSDVVIAAWNALIDQAQSSFESVRRQDADAELARVLERSSGGALARAVNALPDGIIHISDEGRFEYTNSAAVRLFGWDSDEAKRTSLSEAKASGVGVEILDTVRGAFTSSGHFEACCEVLGVGEDAEVSGGSYRLWVIPLQLASQGGGCMVVVRDVSQQMRSERAREDFVTQVTHELRTPLTNIRAYAETLSSGMFDDPNIITECYNVITKETRRLSRLIEDILSVSQLEVGSIELQVDNVDLKALLGEGVRDVRGLADEKDIDIQLATPSKMEAIRADRDKLAVVINNLLGNAIKYTPSGGNVVIGCRLGNGEVVLTFKDNGIGIEPSEHSRVFEKFQRSNDPDVQNETGTGVGLFTAREIVRRHGGDIELISEKGAGSTFLVRLPHRETRASALTTAAEA